MLEFGSRGQIQAIGNQRNLVLHEGVEHRQPLVRRREHHRKISLDSVLRVRITQAGNDIVLFARRYVVLVIHIERAIRLSFKGPIYIAAERKL